MKTAAAVLKARLLKRKIPLVVGWGVTHRCNRKCAYCDLWRKSGAELSTAQIFSIVDALAEMGTVRISFTGGEPLVRADMGRIIDYVHDRGLETKMNSNGMLVPSRIAELRHLDVLNLSLEGPEEIHDAIRGRGSFGEVMAAAEAARSRGIRVGLATVLNRLNLDAIDDILDITRRFKGRVIFQPATRWALGGENENDLAPPEEAYREAVLTLIRKKKAGDKTIGNSVPGLRHLYHWPHPKRMNCASGWISCRIEPDGRVMYCSRESWGFSPLNCTDVSVAEAFQNLRPVACNDCWCAARVELNLAFSLRLPVIVNQIASLVR